MTYKEAESLIIDAYFKDEIKPFGPAFCFCGTLCDNEMGWYKCSARLAGYPNAHFPYGQYSGEELYLMEDALFKHVEKKVGHHYNEEELFNGLVEALNVLKQIHKAHGENVDEEVSIKKRVLVTN